jgi:hypothetical protein
VIGWVRPLGYGPFETPWVRGSSMLVTVFGGWVDPSNPSVPISTFPLVFIAAAKPTASL